VTEHATYREAAAADGAWDAVLKPATTITRADAIDILTAACTPETPVSAAVQEIDGDVVRVALLRDPSRIHGTPTVAACAALADQLTTSQQWIPRPGYRELPMVTVVLGLREGYDADAAVHTPDTVRRHLEARGVTRYGLVPAHLFSARHVDGAVRTYAEPGVVITAWPADLVAVAVVAGELRQDRFVVTDYEAQRTYALQVEEVKTT